MSRLAAQAQEASRIADLTAKLLQSNKELTAAQTELRSARAECEQLRARAAAESARGGELERELAEARATSARRAAELEAQARAATELESQRVALEQELAAARARIAELEVRPAPAPSLGDDLTRIRGIGPAFARALAEHGVTRFDQIAAWTDADVERVAAALKIGAERIRRANWVSGARALVRDSAGEQG